jgi:hypothetical protein
MATHDRVSLQPGDAAQPLSGPPLVDVPRLLERRAARKHARLVSGRNRRKLARWLRTVCARGHEPDSIARRHSVLLHYRVAHARTDMLWIAAALERADDPDPGCMTLLHDLLANPFGDSPLYSVHTPNSELEAILQRVRDGLETRAEHFDSVEAGDALS